MIHLLLLSVAFLSAASGVAAFGRWWTWLKARQGPGWAEPDGGDLLSNWWTAAIGVAVRELPESGLGAFSRRLGLDLRRAGDPMEPERFLARSLLEGLVVAGVSTVFFLLVSDGSMALLGIVAGLFHTFGIRPQTLRGRAMERLGRISRRLPYAIDLAALVLGAGGTPREALELIARQDDPLGEEFTRALAEMQSGAPQHKALADMVDRLQLEDLSILVVAINRGEATGAPLAKALETQAEVFRFRRLQRAERLAVEAPVKMMFPNMLIMISVLLLVLGPVIVKLIQGGMF